MLRWRCNTCDFDASDDIASSIVKIEQDMARELKDMSHLSLEQLGDWEHRIFPPHGFEITAGGWLLFRPVVSLRRHFNDGVEHCGCGGILTSRVYEWNRTASQSHELVSVCCGCCACSQSAHADYLANAAFDVNL